MFSYLFNDRFQKAWVNSPLPYPSTREFNPDDDLGMYIMGGEL